MKVSHWLRCGIFLLAELVTEQGENFPYSCWSSKVGSFLLNMKGTALPFGSAIHDHR